MHAQICINCGHKKRDHWADRETQVCVWNAGKPRRPHQNPGLCKCPFFSTQIKAN